MAERTLNKVYGKLKCAIVRPSIIISSYQEPLPGWTDTISAGGGIAVGVAVGLMRVVQCGHNARVDLVPADYVVNLIITSGFFVAQESEPCLKIVSAGSSHLNPVTPQMFLRDILDYAASNPFEN